MARMSKHSVRQNNEKNVLQAVINNGPIARSQVAKALKLNKVTVSDIFSQLLDEGYLEVVGSGEGSQAGGRKPTLHRFNPHYGYVVSFDLGFHATDMMVTTLTGQVRHSANFWGEGEPIAERLAFMVQQVQALARRQWWSTRAIIGMRCKAWQATCGGTAASPWKPKWHHRAVRIGRRSP